MTIKRERGVLHRIASATVPDGGLTAALLTIHFFVTGSALWFLCAGPLLWFVAAVDSFGSHAAIWAAAGLALPVWPAWYALLALVNVYLERRSFPGRTFRSFWSRWREFIRHAPMMCVLPSVVVALILYNAVLYGSSDVALLLTWAAGAIAFIVITALDIELIVRPSLVRQAIVQAALGALRQPWVGAAWVMVAMGYPVVLLIPIVGPVLLLPGPAVVACVIIIVIRQRGGVSRVDGADQ